MKKIVFCMIVAFSAIYAITKSSNASTTYSNESFASPAAEQAYITQGDMSQNLTDAQTVVAVKKGAAEENYTRTASCSSGCTVNCSRSCTTCCSHQCGRGY